MLADAAFLVARGDDDAEQPQRRGLGDGGLGGFITRTFPASRDALGVQGDFLENGVERNFGLPVPELRPRGANRAPARAGRTAAARSGIPPRARPSVMRTTRSAAAATVLWPAPPATLTSSLGVAAKGSSLLRDEPREIVGMKRVARLVALAVEADVGERPFLFPRVQPIGKNALVRASELARSREHAAAVDPDRKAEAAPYSSASASEASLVVP